MVKITAAINDSELVKSVKRGDKSHLKRFYLQEAEQFKQWVSNNFRIGQLEEAKDLYQDAMIILIRNINDGKLDQPTSSIKTYLYAIGKNLARKRFEKMVREDREQDKLVEHFRFSRTYNYEDLNVDLQNRTAQLVLGMEEPCRSILIHCYYEDMSMREIAALMDYKNENVVRNQKARCMKRLKELIESKLL